MSFRIREVFPISRLVRIRSVRGFFLFTLGPGAWDIPDCLGFGYRCSGRIWGVHLEPKVFRKRCQR